MKFNSVSKVISVFLLFSTFNVFAGGVPYVDFRTPENTIQTYYKYYDNRDILSKCFYPAGFNGSLDKFWTKYQIVDKRDTTKIGKTTNTGIVILKDAVEFIVEVEMRDSKKKNVKTKFWYLLQEIKGEWKIIDHSHISDELYTAYD